MAEPYIKHPQIGMNQERAESALVAVEAFVKETGTEDEDQNLQLYDLICNLRHLCDAAGLDWEYILERGNEHYIAETCFTCKVCKRKFCEDDASMTDDVCSECEEDKKEKSDNEDGHVEF